MKIIKSLIILSVCLIVHSTAFAVGTDEEVTDEDIQNWLEDILEEWEEDPDDAWPAVKMNKAQRSNMDTGSVPPKSKALKMRIDQR